MHSAAPWAACADLEPVAHLGEGHSGQVALMRSRSSGELVAVKFLPRGDAIDERVLREVLHHRRSSGHPNVVAFREAFLTSTHLGLQMEFAGGGSLYDLIAAAPRLPEAAARPLFAQLLAGVAHAHALGIAHRDIKPENLLLSSATGALQLADFGASTDKLEAALAGPERVLGSAATVAPEVLQGGGRQGADGAAADVWACGVTLFAMLAGAYPFEDPRQPGSATLMVQRILRGTFAFPLDVPLSPGVKQLLRGMLQPEPARRWSLDACQRHPWCLVDGAADAADAAADPTTEQQQRPRSPRGLQDEAELRAIVAAARTLGSDTFSDYSDATMYGGAGSQPDLAGLERAAASAAAAAAAAPASSP